MKKYLLNDNPNIVMDLDDVFEYLQNELHFTLDKVSNAGDAFKQSEMMEVLIDSYFTIIDEEEIDEDDYWEDDTEEREKEYRKIQGF